MIMKFIYKHLNENRPQNEVILLKLRNDCKCRLLILKSDISSAISVIYFCISASYCIEIIQRNNTVFGQKGKNIEIKGKSESER